MTAEDKREELEIKKMLELLTVKTHLTHPTKLEELSKSTSWQVRKLVVEHPKVTKAILTRLTQDKSKKVSEAAIKALSA
jgi:hypothetical protein